MQYISAEEFLSQSREVQQVFKGWWKPEMYDLFFRDFGNNENTFLNGVYKSCIQDYETQNNATKGSTFLPLLTEGQLRQFIEDKMGEVLEIMYLDCICNYKITLGKKSYETGQNNLLQALWKVACQLANGVVK